MVSTWGFLLVSANLKKKGKKKTKRVLKSWSKEKYEVRDIFGGLLALNHNLNFSNYFASYFVVIQDPCLHACTVHCFRAFETSMLMLYTVYFSIATTAVAAVYAIQPHGTPLHFKVISPCAASLHLFCTNTRYKFHECNKRWFWNCGFV